MTEVLSANWSNTMQIQQSKNTHTYVGNVI